MCQTTALRNRREINDKIREELFFKIQLFASKSFTLRLLSKTEKWNIEKKLYCEEVKLSTA